MEQTKISGSQSSQTNQTNHAARAKASGQQGGTTDAANASAGGGFFALLAAMGDPADGGVELAAPETAQLSAELMPDGTALPIDASVLAAWQGLFSATQSIGIQDSAASLTEGAAAAATAAVALAGMLGISEAAVGAAGAALSTASAALGKVRDGVGAVGSELGMTGAALGALGRGAEGALGGAAADVRSEGLVAQTLQLDGSADFQDGQVQGAVSGFARATARLQSIQSQKVGKAFEASAKHVGGEIPLKQAPGSEAAATAVSSVVGERLAAGLQSAGAAAGRSLATSEAQGTQWNSALTDGLMALASVRGPDALAGARAGEGRARGGAGSEEGSALPTREMGNVDGAPVFAEANVSGLEDQVAEQVAYWVNQKTQNAQLTLDRDGHPVEVSVTLSGNEAHVSFRSDQPETRALLDQSMAQLSDLLRSEGLVLSGMSVDTSARDGSPGGREPRQPDGREGARQAQVVAKVPTNTPLASASGAGTNRSVDVFV